MCSTNNHNKEALRKRIPWVRENKFQDNNLQNYTNNGASANVVGKL